MFGGGRGVRDYPECTVLPTHRRTDISCVVTQRKEQQQFQSLTTHLVLHEVLQIVLHHNPQNAEEPQQNLSLRVSLTLDFSLRARSQ